MHKPECLIYYMNQDREENRGGGTVMTFEEVVRLAKSPRLLRSIGRYRAVTFYCPSFTAFARPFLSAVICRLLTFGRCRWVNEDRQEISIGTAELMRQFGRFVFEHLTCRAALRQMGEVVGRLEETPKESGPLCLDHPALYLRLDLAYGYAAGGSVGHIAGVINHLDRYCGERPLLFTTDRIPTVRADLTTRVLRPPVPYRNVRDAAGILYNGALLEAVRDAAEGRAFSFIYQRSALNSFSGLQFAMERKLPFVLEYNGSEVWTADKWGGRKLRERAFSSRIELLTFLKADLIVCVSGPLKRQLLEQGIEEDKILVNFNGVDTERYHPELEGAQARALCGADEKTCVIGFIGTFGAWHGAEVLARAFSALCAQPESAQKIHLLLIGDGMRMPEVRRILSESGALSRVTLTGVVPQGEGPRYLAACDVLVSPQVRNPDGTPFFGSPTKLFEYMAMGKAIVASNMDQMAEVLRHNETALLCEPGDPEALRSALARLTGDRDLRGRLGARARRVVCEHYTWQKHVEKIMRALERRIGAE